MRYEVKTAEPDGQGHVIVHGLIEVEDGYLILKQCMLEDCPEGLHHNCRRVTHLDPVRMWAPDVWQSWRSMT